eukprot:TRINITY_DN4768_c1_g2_i1.p1 TRINITY_DN4768_c1_g2~~TRINITY_DN4768_c1_g2_i1.p1  ORF type:complete len:795 (+),score=237.27 TRINITY_DN4768_c1_g2_i1:69-2453(+)
MEAIPHEEEAPRPVWADWETIDWAYDQEAHVQYKNFRKNVHDTAYDGVRRWWVKARESFSGWAPAIIVGAITGVIAGMIDLSCSLLSSLRFGYCRDMPWLGEDACCPGSEGLSCPTWVAWKELETPLFAQPIFYIGISVLYGTICAWLVVTYAPFAAGSGIPEIKTILSGIRIKRVLGFWTVLIKCVGLCLSVASGLSLGKEGPFVHVASCVGNLVADYFPKYRYHESKKREVLSAACAAGVAVAFGAPIGGVLFSLEEASYYFPHKTMWKAFFCAVVAALVLKSIDPSHSGSLVMFKLDYNHPWHFFELFPHCLLGALGGVVGALFNSLNAKWIRVKRMTFIVDHPIVEIFCITLLTAVLNYTTPSLQRSATSFLSQLFRECRPHDRDGLCELESEVLAIQLLTAAFIKLCLTIVTFGTKVPAGLFVPSLFIGACLGRVAGMWVNHLHMSQRSSYMFSECEGVPENLCVIPGVYAIVGAAAVLGGVTRMTLSLVVIVFELTGGLEYLVPVMVAVMISKWVGEWIGGDASIYEIHIMMNGYPYLDPKVESSPDITVRALLSEKPTLAVIPNEGWSVRQVKDLLSNTAFKGYPVVKSLEEPLVVGWAQRGKLSLAIETALRMSRKVGPDTGIVFSPDVRNRTQSSLLDATNFIDSTPLQISPDASVDKLLQLFKSLGLRSILVAHHSCLEGVITRKDVLDFLAADPGNVELQKFSPRVDRASSLASAGDDSPLSSEKGTPRRAPRPSPPPPPRFDSTRSAGSTPEPPPLQPPAQPQQTRQYTRYANTPKYSLRPD